MRSQYIQRKRTKGFNLQAASPDGRPVVSCTRGRHEGGKWCNPYRVMHRVNGGGAGVWAVYNNDKYTGQFSYFKDHALTKVVNLYREHVAVSHEQIRQELSGHHLSCWCAPGTPCHVQDVLLPIINGEEPRTY